MEKKLAAIVLDAPIFGGKRRPLSEDDFGDDLTAGLHLKRRVPRIPNHGDHDFGIYLGLVDKQYHVGTMMVMSFVPSRLESFDTLEELHKEWILD